MVVKSIDVGSAAGQAVEGKVAQGKVAPGKVADGECSVIENVMGILGRAWAGAVVQAMLNGNERFSDIARAIPGVTDGMLSARLRELCARGLTERIVAPGPPVSVSYRLTPAGLDAAPVIDAARVYGLAHPEILGVDEPER